jgi:hypothetical protein
VCVEGNCRTYRTSAGCTSCPCAACGDRGCCPYGADFICVDGRACP